MDPGRWSKDASRMRAEAKEGDLDSFPHGSRGRHVPGEGCTVVSAQLSPLGRLQPERLG